MISSWSLIELLKGLKSEQEELGEFQVARRNLPNSGQAEKQFSEKDTLSGIYKSQQKPRSPRVYFKASLSMAAN